MKNVLLSISLLLPLVAGASTLYKCTDNSGVVLYTNQKPTGKSCTVLSQQSPPPPPPAAQGSKPKAVATATPGDFPRVSNGEQKARDSDRRAILDRELANELQGVEKARKAILDAGAQPAETLRPLNDTLALHERNVEALKKELGNLR